MKLTRCDNGIYLSNLPKTILGIICAIAYPLFYVITAYDLLEKSFADIGLLELIALTLIFPVYVYWLAKEFYKNILRYRIKIDQNGIKEYRLFLKSKELSWNEIKEFICESSPAPYKTRKNFFKITFYSKDDKLVIQTWAFPDDKKELFQGEIFKMCHKFFHD